MKKATFDRIMTELCQYYSKELSPIILEVWWDSFKEMSDKDFAIAFKLTIEHHNFFPSPAQMKKLVQDHKPSLRPEHQEFKLIAPAPEQMATTEDWKALKERMQNLAKEKRLRKHQENGKSK